MFQSFYNVKNSANIAYDNFSHYCSAASSSLAKNAVITTAKIAAKSIIHGVRCVTDVICDIGNIILNAVRTPAEDNNSSSVQTESNYTNDDSTLAKFITNTWYENNNMYLGEVSKTLGESNHPLAKLIPDILSCPYTIASSGIEEIIQMLKNVNQDALESAYKAGCKDQAEIAEHAYLSSNDKGEYNELSYNQNEAKFPFCISRTDSTLGDFISIEDNSKWTQLENLVGENAGDADVVEAFAASAA